VVGVDFGTLPVRAVVVRASDGVELGTGVGAYARGSTERAMPSDKRASSGAPLPPGWALQDPADWRAALGAAVRAARRSADARPEAVVAIGTDRINELAHERGEEWIGPRHPGNRETFTAADVPVTEFIVAGGLKRNRLLMQVYASVPRRPVTAGAPLPTRAWNLSAREIRIENSHTDIARELPLWRRTPFSSGQTSFHLVRWVNYAILRARQNNYNDLA
jgi:hypothetical protein